MEEFNGWVDFRALSIIRSKINKRFYNVTIDDLAEHGLLEFIIRFPNKRCTKKAVDLAAKNGHLDTVKWLCEHRTEGCFDDTVTKVVDKGHLEVLKYFVKIGIGIGIDYHILHVAAYRGNLDIIKYIYENREKYPSMYCTCTVSMDIAAEYGHLEIVKYLLTIGIKCNKETMYRACENGHSEVVKFLKENCRVVVDDRALSLAIEYCHLELIKYLYSIRVTCRNRNISDAVKQGRLDIIQFLHDNSRGEKWWCNGISLDIAAKNGHLEVLKYIHENGIEISYPSFTALRLAVENGHLEVIKFLYSIGKTIDHYNLEKAMLIAIEKGYLEVVKFLYSFSSLCSSDIINNAASYGHLEIVQFLHEMGVQCNEDSITFASRNGFIEVVKYLFSIGAKCTSDAMFHAAGCGHMEIVQYLHDNGHACNQNVMDVIAKNGHLNLLK